MARWDTSMAKTKFCVECYNFEDRGNIDGFALCGKGHRPGITCQDFIDREERSREVSRKRRVEAVLRV